MKTDGKTINDGVSRSESEKNAGTTNSAIGKQATGKQLVSIVFILAMATKMFLFPILLIRATGRDAYIIVSISGCVDLIMLGVTVAAIKLGGDVDFFTMTTRILGKVGAKIAVGLIALFLFFKLNIATAEALSFYGDNVFTDFSAAIMIFVLLFFFVAAGVHTLRALCRLNELLIPIIVLCMAMLIAIVVMTGVDLANILPSLQHGKQFGGGLLRHGAWLGDFTPLVLFIGRTKTKKHTGWFVAASGVLGTGTAVFFAIVMCAAFGNVPLLVDTGTNLASILQFAIGNVYGRIDMVSFIIWSISVFIAAALFFYATARCVAFVIGKNSNLVISLVLCAALYFAQVFVMTDPTLFSAVVTSFACSAMTAAFTVAVPALALVGALITRRKNIRRSENNMSESETERKNSETSSEAKV